MSKAMRKIFASGEMKLKAKRSSNGKVEIYSFFPIDRAGCECQDMITKWKKDMASLDENAKRDVLSKTRFLECPRSKIDMKRYKITCRKCGEVLGYCWAKDSSLTDWCDLHYVNWTDGKEWYGCFTPHISPITEELCFECCCGEDTRDFRANMTLPGGIANRIEISNRIGREFGRTDSKFKATTVAEDVLPFNIIRR